MRRRSCVIGSRAPLTVVFCIEIFADCGFEHAGGPIGKKLLNRRNTSGCHRDEDPDGSPDHGGDGVAWAFAGRVAVVFGEAKEGDYVRNDCSVGRDQWLGLCTCR